MTEGSESPLPPKPKSKGGKKKKKKISSNNESNSPEMLSVFSEQSDFKNTNMEEASCGMETVTVVSSSSKPRSKTSKKKKKKIAANSDGDGIEIMSVASTKSGRTAKSKSSPTKKKKKKKIAKDSESTDVTRECSTRSDDVIEDDKSLMTGSVKSINKNKSKSSKPKKKKSKSLGESKSTIPRPERTKSLEPTPSASLSVKRTKSLEPGQPPDFMIKRTMSLDAGGRGRAHGGRGRGSPTAGRGRGRGRGPPPGGWASSRVMRPQERMKSSSHGARSVSDDRSVASQDRSAYGGRSLSQDRSPYGSTRVTNGRGVPGRGRRRMSFPPPSASDTNPPLQSKPPRGNIYRAPSRSTFDENPSRGNMYRAPSRPRSILRNSSHHKSSHHRNDRSIATSSSHSSSYHQRRRVSMDPNAGSRSRDKYDMHSSFGSEIDSSDVESDDDESSFAMEDRSFAMEDSSKKYAKQVPRTVVNKGFSRHLSGLGTNSSHHTSSHFKGFGQSTRSLLTIERSEFQNENRFIRTLRYIHFLAPHPNEDPIKKKIRIVTWCALFLDFLNALVAIITYGGSTTQCCGKSIMSAIGGGEFNWDQTILIITCMYMFLIFLEVVPVMRDAFPFNLLNPFIGFLITFAVFFSDSITETAIMWTVEALAVGCEVINYRLRVKRFGKRKARLKHTKKEIEKLRKIKRKVKDQFDSGKVLARSDSAQFVLDLNDSSSFADDESFFDDIETQHNSTDANTVASRTALTTVSNIGTARETRLLRERRQLIRSQAETERDLRYHFVGVVFNVFLVVFSLLMLVIIAKNGGMCIKGMKFGNIFKNDQLEKCDLCANGNQECQKCSYEDAAETIYSDDQSSSQCYYPYGIINR